MAMEEEETLEFPEMESQNDEKKRDFILDEPSPRCVLELPMLSPCSDSGCSSSANSTEKLAQGSEANLPQWKNMIDTFKKKSVRRFSVIPLLQTYDIIAKRNLKRKLTKMQNSPNLMIDWGGMAIPKPSWRNFDYKELEAATDNFSSENMIGKGGHAKVYKGRLPDGQVVAVKKIVKSDKKEENKIGDFLSELGIIAHINHPNAAKLLGFSVDGDLHLVLEYLPHGSLASVLHGEEECLDWKRRFKASIGIAEGLQYLHHECPRRVIHRDIKASNILLGEDYEAQISDFGLAKWLPENWVQHVVFPIEGTFGYLAPEAFMHGIVDEKTDVFAYGVLLLEIITGRYAVDSSRQSLAMWAKPLLQENNATELVDPRLGDDYDPNEMERAMFTALMCINHLPSTRPYMNQVVHLLKGEEEASMELEQKTNAGRAVVLDGCYVQDHTCSSYLDDMNRHMQLVME
ncbi:receptor-like cytosolic serine/threonine-protein kinase RBK1 isoform X2 [Manihot esculenta]|uniref:non-specific serine/threonine protein kinase n=1 Tax=Manihot esculenta TaxID=3983 RepID=A0A2C9UQI1_MANES|nr:receptor-like cytosolic serine/threonine-protein kinase RBK1 isoform X2 [Manihot esculenta]OAY33484.1 hypothetical protein MANES_13G100400v8 [Manihot esculenta]